MEILDLLQFITPNIIRVSIIVFSTLGMVYLCGRLLFPSLEDRGKNIIAAISIVLISFITTFVFDYLEDFNTLSVLIYYVTESTLYALVSTVFYVVLGWRFYSRVDNWLDNKFAKDESKNNKRKRK